MKWKAFDAESWRALLSSLKRLIGMADVNASAISDLGEDMARLAGLTEGALAGKQDKSAAVQVTLPADGWQQDDTGDYPYYYDIPAPGVTAADRAEVTLEPESLAASASCILCPTCETLNGVIRLRAASAPEELKVDYWIDKGRSEQ